MDLSIVKKEIKELEKDNENSELYLAAKSMGSSSTQENIDIYIENRSKVLNIAYIEVYSDFEKYLVAIKPMKILSDKDKYGVYIAVKISDELNILKRELYPIGLSELKELKICVKEALDIATLLEIVVEEANAPNNIKSQTKTKDEISKNLVEYCTILPNKINLIIGELKEFGHLFFESLFDKNAYYLHFGC